MNRALTAAAPLMAGPARPRENVAFGASYTLYPRRRGCLDTFSGARLS